MEEFTITKVCTKCGEEKGIGEFYKHKTCKYGVDSTCAYCMKKKFKKWHKENREKANARNKKYAEKNREAKKAYDIIYCNKNKKRKAEYRKKYAIENREKIIAGQKRYYKENKEKLKEYQKKYNKENKEKVSADRKKYVETNKEKVKERRKKYKKENKIRLCEEQKAYRQTKKGRAVARKANSKYKALKRNATIEDFNPIDVLERDRYICQCCGCKTLPNNKNYNHPKYPNVDHIIPLSKGGDHSMKNTQCLCRQCNLEKHNNQKQDQLLLFGY